MPGSPRHRAPPLRLRRSHAQRTAETRAKIIGAVVDSIAERGVQRTTAQVIAQRAGVTWGAVQHHFGGKPAVLLAVLDESFVRFVAQVEDIPLAAPLATRAALFIDRAWDHFRSRHYRAAFEILLNHLGRQDRGGEGDWRPRLWHAWNTVWSRLFADAQLPRQRSLALQHYTISVLSGLATMVTLQGSVATLPKRELDLLKETLVRDLTAARPTGLRSRQALR